MRVRYVERQKDTERNDSPETDKTYWKGHKDNSVNSEGGEEEGGGEKRGVYHNKCGHDESVKVDHGCRWSARWRDVRPFEGEDLPCFALN